MESKLDLRVALKIGAGQPIWRDIPSANERIYRVTPEGHAGMIGRTVSEEGAAALNSTQSVDLGRGLSLRRRRVAGALRLEIDGVDGGTVPGLTAVGCFTEIIAYQLRVFVPHGDGVDTEAILSRVMARPEPDAAAA